MLWWCTDRKAMCHSSKPCGPDWTCSCSSQRHSPDIGNIGAPLQILGDCVKVDKESREQQHRDSCNRPYKCGYLGGVEDIHRVTSAKKMCIKQCKHALPVVRWRQRQPTAQETGLPGQCRWTGLWRAGSDLPQEAALSSSTLCCSTWWGRSPKITRSLTDV